MQKTEKWTASKKFLSDPLPGCPHYQEFVRNPLQVNGSCFATCPTDTTVNYLCSQSSTSSVGRATCTVNHDWIHSPQLGACTPAGEVTNKKADKILTKMSQSPGIFTQFVKDTRRNALITNIRFHI